MTGASSGPRMWSRSGSTGAARSMIGSARAEQRPQPQRLGGSSAVTRKTSQVSDGRAERRRRGCRSSPPRARCPSKARVAMSSETVNPMPGDRAAAGDARPSRPAGAAARGSAASRATSRRRSRPACRRRSRRRCPSVIGERERVAQEAAVDRDARVRQREQRDDHVARPRVVQVLQPLVRRDRGREPEPGRPGQLRASAARGTAGSSSVARSRSPRAAGAAHVKQPHGEPDDDRVDAGLEASPPRRRHRAAK